MNARQSLGLGALAALGASLCCVAPLVLVMLGIGGAWVATLTSLEPLRPLFIVLTLSMLVLAWRKIHRSEVECAPGAACAEPSVQRRQRLIFWSVSALLLVLLAFPWYAFVFY